MAWIKDPLKLRYRISEGGWTGQKNWFSPSCRKRYSPRRPTNQQSQIAVSKVAEVWRNFSPSQKESWDDYGVDNPVIDRYGELVNLNGYIWFCKCNIFKSIAHLPLILDAPLNSSSQYNPSIINLHLDPIEGLHCVVNHIPLNNEILVFHSKINLPITHQKNPNPFDYNSFHLVGTHNDYLIASKNTLITNNRVHWVSCEGYDEEGLKSLVSIDSLFV